MSCHLEAAWGPRMENIGSSRERSITCPLPPFLPSKRDHHGHCAIKSGDHIGKSSGGGEPGQQSVHRGKTGHSFNDGAESALAAVRACRSKPVTRAITRSGLRSSKISGPIPSPQSRVSCFPRRCQPSQLVLEQFQTFTFTKLSETFYFGRILSSSSVSFAFHARADRLGGISSLITSVPKSAS